MPIFECWEKFKGKDLHKLIAKRTGIEHPLTVQDKAAYKKAAEDFQKENINNLNNIYSDLGLKDYKKTEAQKESIPSVKIGDEVDTPNGKGVIDSINSKGAAIVKLDNGSKLMYTPKLWEGQSLEKDVIPESKTDEVNTLSDAVKKYDDGENYTFDDMVNDVDRIANDTNNETLIDAVNKYRKEQQEDRKLSGRGDMDAAQNEFEKVLQTENEKEQSLPKEQKAPSVSGVDGGFTAKGGNKVVDEKGEPISLYHYSPTGKINEFFVEKSKHGGIYFGDKDYFGKDFDFLLNNDKGALTEVNVKATKIASLEDAGVRFTDELTPNKINKLKEKGFDALYGEGLSGNEYVIFDEKNIQVVNEQSLPKEQKAPSVSGVSDIPKAIEENKQKLSDDILYAGDEAGLQGNTYENLSELYQKSKSDGSNPELVKAVEDAIGEKSLPKEQKAPSVSGEKSKHEIINNYGDELKSITQKRQDNETKLKEKEISFDEWKQNEDDISKERTGIDTKYDKLLGGDRMGQSGDKKSKTLYHFTGKEALNDILDENIISGEGKEGGEYGGISTTTDPNLDARAIPLEYGNVDAKTQTTADAPIRIDFNKQKLKDDGYKVILGNDNMGTFQNEQEMRIFKLKEGEQPADVYSTEVPDVKNYIENIQINKELLSDKEFTDLTAKLDKEKIPYTVKGEQSQPKEQKADEKINQQGNETPKSETDKSDQQSQLGSAKKSQQPPKPPEETKGAAEGQENKVGIHVEYPPTSVNYMGTGKLETEFGIEEREPTQRKRDIYTIKEADELLDKGWNIQKELNKVDSGEKTFISDAEYINFTRYAAELSDRLRGIKDVKSPEYDRTLRELNRVANAANTAGKDTARALGIRGRFSTVAEGSYGEFMLNEMAANNDAPLTEKQKETAHAEFEKLDATRKKLDEDTKAFEEKVSAFRAEQELGKTKKSASSGKKRTHEDLVKEREDILKNIGNKWKDAGKDVLSSDIPFRKQIAAIAPDVLKLAKNLVEDGIIKLEDVVKNIHEKIKPNAPEVEEKDIHDIIAGEYNKKKITKKDAAIAMENLRIEAQLLNKYERLLKGEEPKNEKAKRKRNQEIEDLRKKIKDLRKEESESNKFYGESDAAERKEFDNEKREANKFYGEEKDAELKKLESLQKRNESETKKIKEKIAEGDFELPVKKTPLMEDKELQKKFPEQFKATQKAVDDYIKVKREIALRRLKQMYENKTPEEKTIEIFSKALNVPRTLMASFDFSAPLRQAIVATTAHPQIASKALKFMFEAAKDEKVYNRWIDNVHSDPRWSVAEKTKLGITDPESLHVKKAEEAFQGAPYAEKIPIVGVGVKASERAYIGFLNKLRWDLFNMYADRFEEQGKTYENNQKLYEGISSFINSETGRGGMKGLENAAPVLNWFLFASKLIASRLNMLGLSDIPNLTVRGATLGKYGLDYGFYTRLPKEIRIEAAKDMAKFLAVGIATLVLANQLGASVELDPRSSDFGKIKIGNTRWDIWGGFQPYARVLTQSLTGERKTTTTGNIQQLDGKGFMGQTRFTPIINFARGKLAPVPASVIDLAIKKDAAGQPVTIQGELIGDVVPLVIQDTYAAMKDQGVKALFTVGIPSAFGVGVQTYKPREIKSTQQKIKSMNKSSSKKTANKNMNK